MISTTKKRGSKYRLFFGSERPETWNDNFEFKNEYLEQRKIITRNKLVLRELGRPGTTTTKINMEWTRLRTRHDTFVLELDRPEQGRLGNEVILRRPGASPCRKVSPPNHYVT